MVNFNYATKEIDQLWHNFKKAFKNSFSEEVKSKLVTAWANGSKPNNVLRKDFNTSHVDFGLQISFGFLVSDSGFSSTLSP
jgi:hypothetical protein